MPEYIFASQPTHYIEAAKLFRAYAAWLNIDLSFQGFEEELTELQTMYAQPKGCLLLVKEAGNYIACVALREFTKAEAELKRMFVLPEHRNKHLASEMMKKIELFAREAGYSCIRLDTLDNMLPAVNFYRKNGFQQTEPYYYNPNTNTVYFKKNL